jgi:predicted nucleic acid-binding protein
LITAVDTSILLDVIGGDPEFGQASAASLQRCLRDGQLVACEIVWAECAAGLPDAQTAIDRLATLRVRYVAAETPAALSAGRMWSVYRRRQGTRERIIADFLIGAHAQLQADRLLTRDRGFYRGYFDGLEILDPSVGHIAG